MFKKYLAFLAFIGIVVGRGSMALSQGFRAGAASDKSPDQAIAHALANQNGILLAHILGVQQKLLSELIDSSEKEAESSQNIHEISCRPEHLEVVRKTLNPETEGQFKELAFWGQQTAPSYDVSLKSMSIEAERSADVGRSHDIVLVFHVAGKGDDALRFQAEASRKLRDIASDPSLRVDVRWT